MTLTISIVTYKEMGTKLLYKIIKVMKFKKLASVESSPVKNSTALSFSSLQTMLIKVEMRHIMNNILKTIKIYLFTLCSILDLFLGCADEFIMSFVSIPVKVTNPRIHFVFLILILLEE